MARRLANGFSDRDRFAAVWCNPSRRARCIFLDYFFSSIRKLLPSFRKDHRFPPRFKYANTETDRVQSVVKRKRQHFSPTFDALSRRKGILVGSSPFILARPNRVFTRCKGKKQKRLAPPRTRIERRTSTVVWTRLYERAVSVSDLTAARARLPFPADGSVKAKMHFGVAAITFLPPLRAPYPLPDFCPLIFRNVRQARAECENLRRLLGAVLARVMQNSPRASSRPLYTHVSFPLRNSPPFNAPPRPAVCSEASVDRGARSEESSTSISGIGRDGCAV